MRHGQGYHASASNGRDIRDPHLTGRGMEQARETRDAFKRHDKVELLLASPLRRALQTCAIAHEPSVKRGLQIHAIPYAEEASTTNCDTGSPRPLLVEEFPLVDFDLLKDDWYKHDGQMATDPKALLIRAATLRRWIRDRPEKEIVLVAHGFFNHYLTGDVNEEGEQTTPWWTEAELRTYTFVEGDGGISYVGGQREVDGKDGAPIQETDESLLRLKDKKQSVVKNTNRPADRKNSLTGFQYFEQTSK